MNDDLLIALVFVALVPAAIALSTRVTMASFASKRFRLRPLSPRGNQRAFRAALKLDSQVAIAEFRFLNCYHCPSIPSVTVCAWRRYDRPTYVTLLINKKQQVMDIVTEFEGGIGLTTANGVSGGFFPSRPGSYDQYFPKMNFAALWRKHCEAEDHLLRYGGVVLGDPEIAFEDAFVEGARRQVAYARTISLWYLRVTGWYIAMLMKKRGNLGMGIPEQHQAGLIVLPNDLDFEPFTIPET